MRIFSGIQPSGMVHLGNYLGAMKNWVHLQENNEAIFCVVNYHAITVEYDAKNMPSRIINTAKDILASGIDPNKSTIFLQSDLSEHTELAWLLNSITSMGELSRMTQYKEKSEKHEQRVGLFDYPVLMAADILLYKTEGVPVGEDQTQHVELARELSRRFNNKFGKVFAEPRPIMTKAKRVMSLLSNNKMSKSDAPNSYIALTDTADTIRKKISSAVTDDGKSNEISINTINLIGLYGEVAGADAGQSMMDQRKMGIIKYSEFKPALAQALIKELEPFQKRRALISDETVKQILLGGAKKLKPIAQNTLKEVKQKMGLMI